jgi:UDP-2,4-diacetamido-2,4,6-trideoxy-beta-L-altropyranose hydrolase
MDSIAFRTNSNKETGLGHLTRCIALANEIIKKGTNCIFVVDFIEDGIAPFLADHDVYTLYTTPQKIIDASEDAQLFLAAVKEQVLKWVIVDDYRLGEEWERKVLTLGAPLCAFDDILRPHQCDLLIDIKWRGTDTQTLYDTLVPLNTTKLLGPSYIPLSPDYGSPQAPKNSSELFTIMIGFGGGGNLHQTEKIIDSLLEGREKNSQPIRLLPVVGPLSDKIASFIARYENYQEVEPVVGKTNLYPYFCQTDFYIGAAGGIIYQLLALRIPALTFSIAENQLNEIGLLQDIGHFFHIETWSDKDLKKLPSFADVLTQQYRRIKKIGESPRLTIDGRGAHRISKTLLRGEFNPITTAPPYAPFSAEKHEELSSEHELRAICDQDINHYLICRNLDENRRNMIGSKKISSLHHYTWWFNTIRESYLLNKNNKPCLYIWHEIKNFKGQEFLIGGWFVCNKEAEFQDALLALNWQLVYCDKIFPTIPWLAVINRQNKYVKLMNDYVGFHEINEEHSYADAIADLFDGAHFDEFYFVIRE